MSPIIFPVPYSASRKRNNYLRVGDIESLSHIIRRMAGRAGAGMNHEIKDQVMAALPPSVLKDLGCDNPDIHVASRSDDHIVLTPSATARKNGDCRKTKVKTGIRASDLLEGDWRNHIFPLKLTVIGGMIESIFEEMDASIPPGVQWDEMLESYDILEVFFLPVVNEGYELRPALLMVLARPKSSIEPDEILEDAEV